MSSLRKPGVDVEFSDVPHPTQNTNDYQEKFALELKDEVTNANFDNAIAGTIVLCIVSLAWQDWERSQSAEGRLKWRKRWMKMGSKLAILLM